MPVESGSRLRPVSSRQNALVKDLRKAFSQAELAGEGFMAVEGLRMVEEAIRSGLRFHAVFFSESGRVHSERLLPQIAGQAEAVLLPDDVFSSAVATQTPQGVAALVKPRTVRLEDILEGFAERSAGALLVGLSGVQDPGNVGTVIRSAEAFSALAVILGEKTVSPFNAKVVRASAGSVFRQPVIRAPLASALATLKQRGLRVLATSSHKGKSLEEADLTGPAAVLIGNEGAGLAPAILAQADELITIPHSPRVESLNAGIAAAIVLYEASRQRRSR